MPSTRAARASSASPPCSTRRRSATSGADRQRRRVGRPPPVPHARAGARLAANRTSVIGSPLRDSLPKGRSWIAAAFLLWRSPPSDIVQPVLDQLTLQQQLRQVQQSAVIGTHR